MYEEFRNHSLEELEFLFLFKSFREETREEDGYINLLMCLHELRRSDELISFGKVLIKQYPKELEIYALVVEELQMLCRFDELYEVLLEQEKHCGTSLLLTTLRASGGVPGKKL